MVALKGTKASIACTVVTYNRDDFIETCIASLLAAHSDTLDVTVIVINNGSPDGTTEVLKRYAPEDVTVITNTQNVSLSRALNQGIDAGFAAGTDYIALLNDDIEMRPGALAELVAVAAEVEGAVVTPLQINYRKPDELDGLMMKKVQGTPELINDAVYRGEIKRYYAQPHGMIGAAQVAARETYETIGYFDPLFRFYGADNDYFTRATRLGRPLILATRAHMLHMHGRVSTTKALDRADWLRRWKSEFRGRQLMKLKFSDRSLPHTYLRLFARGFLDLPKHARRFGRAGAMATLSALFGLLGEYTTIRDRRSEERDRMAMVRGSAGS